MKLLIDIIDTTNEKNIIQYIIDSQIKQTNDIRTKGPKSKGAIKKVSVKRIRPKCSIKKSWNVENDNSAVSYTWNNEFR